MYLLRINPGYATSRKKFKRAFLRHIKQDRLEITFFSANFLFATIF